MKLELRIGYTQTKHWQEFQILSEILSAAFGGGTKGEEVKGIEPRTVGEAQALMRSIVRPS